MDQCSLCHRRSFHRAIAWCPVAIGILLVAMGGATSVADVPAPNVPTEALFGEWPIVEMVHKGRIQDIPKGEGPWIKLEKGYYSKSFRGRQYLRKYPCTIGNVVFDVQFDNDVSKGLYEYKDDTLRIICHSYFGDRPTSFDAVGNPNVTLIVLKRAED